MTAAPRPLLVEHDARRASGDPVGMRFSGCDAGWIRFRFDALMGDTDEVAATHLDDPFARMIEWLEAARARRGVRDMVYRARGTDGAIHLFRRDRWLLIGLVGSADLHLRRR